MTLPHTDVHGKFPWPKPQNHDHGCLPSQFLHLCFHLGVIHDPTITPLITTSCPHCGPHFWWEVGSVTPSATLLASCLSLSHFPVCFSPRRKDYSRCKLCHVETCLQDKVQTLAERRLLFPGKKLSCLPSFLVHGCSLPCPCTFTAQPAHTCNLPRGALSTSCLGCTVPLAPLPTPLCSLIQPRPLLLQEAFPDYPPPFFLPSLGSGTLLCAHLSPSTHPLLFSVSIPSPVHRSHEIGHHIANFAKRLAKCLTLYADLFDAASPETEPTKTLGR